MKRHPSLIPLSREHHDGLVLAQLLKNDVPDYKGLPTTIEGKVEYTRRLWQEALQPHFEKEEQLLIPRTRGYGPELEAMSERVTEEHRQIRRQIEALGEAATAAQLDELGRLLERHIRFEEREWFALIQQELPPGALEQLAGLE